MTSGPDGAGGAMGGSGSAVTYEWDTENRLTAVYPSSPVNGNKKLIFDYDYMGRRVRKRVYTRTAGAWPSTPSEDRRFVYDNWRPLVELNGLSSNAVVRKWTWGADLAGQSGGGVAGSGASPALDGAGGIGGLLATYDVGSSKSYIHFYDANGNTGQLIDISNGSIAAKYEYDAFGNTLVSSGTYAATNPFKFSTKWFDSESGLGYWGYRYYHPKMGRWVGRDPLDERGGLNLFSYLSAPTSSFDALGLFGPPGLFDFRREDEYRRQCASNRLVIDGITYVNPIRCTDCHNPNSVIFGGDEVPVWGQNPDSARACHQAGRALQVTGGVVEIGCGFLTSEFGFGLLLIAHGSDQVFAGCFDDASICNQAMSSAGGFVCDKAGVDADVRDKFVKPICGFVGNVGTGLYATARCLVRGSASGANAAAADYVVEAGSAAHNAANAQRLRACLRLHERLGHARIRISGTMAPGDCRLAVYRCSTREVMIGKSDSALHYDVPSQFGADPCDFDDLVGGFVRASENGELSWMTCSGTYPSTNAPANCEEVIRGIVGECNR